RPRSSQQRFKASVFSPSPDDAGALRRRSNKRGKRMTRTVALLVLMAVLAGCGGGSDHGGSSGAGTWGAQGPGPTLGGGGELAAQSDPVAGAVNVVLPHPRDVNLLYAASVNGGIWRTQNAADPNGPRWKPLTDDQASLSIGALVFDPTDSSLRTLLAGIG